MSKKVKKAKGPMFPNEVFVTYDNEEHYLPYDNEEYDLRVSETPNDAKDGQKVALYVLSETYTKRVHHELE